MLKFTLFPYLVETECSRRGPRGPKKSFNGKKIADTWFGLTVTSNVASIGPSWFCKHQQVEDQLVHNCTIFLCSLDVRNIVQGGDPLYAGFFSTQGSGGYTWPKWVRFFAKNNCLGCEPEKKNKFWWKKSFLWPGEAVFCDLRSFPKNKDRSPKIRINLPTLSSAH